VVDGRYERTPLHFAAANGHADLCVALLSLGADLNVRDRYGLTPLNLAAQYGTVHVCSALLESGANVDVFGGFDRDDDSEIIGIETSVSNGADRIIAEVAEINDGAKLPGGRWLIGFTPLAQAACHEHRALVELLLKYGANPNLADFRGDTPLHLLSTHDWSRSKEIVEMLIEHGADVDAMNNKAYRPDDFANAEFADAFNAAREERQEKLSALRNAAECRYDD
jgi:ankyrin repeat protein